METFISVEESTDELSEDIAGFRCELDNNRSGDLGHVSLLESLSLALWKRFERDRSLEDLDDCIAVERDVLRLLPVDDSDRSRILFNLASSIRSRYEQSGDIADLEKVISLYRSSVELQPPGHPDRSSSLNNLGIAIQARYEQSGDIADLEESISLYRSSLELQPPGHPLRSSSLNNLGTALQARYERSHDLADLQDGIGALKCGADHDFSSSFDRLQTADRWARIAREYNHPTCLEAYGTALSLLEMSLNVAPTLEMQHRLLTGSRGFPSLAVDAAAYTIDKEDYIRAVEFLEQGRALLWMQMRGHRATLDGLAEDHHELASTFADVSQKLETLSTNASSKAALVGSNATAGLSDDSRRLDEMTKQGRLLSEERKEIIRKIRLVPGFEDFQRPTPFAKLQKAADEGPVIVVNLSKYRSDALIVLRDRYPLLVPLSDDNLEFYYDMFELHERLLDARHNSLTELPGI